MKLLYPKTGSRLKICYFCRPNGRSMTAATALMDFPFSLQQSLTKTLMDLCLCRYLSVILYFFVTKLFAGNKRFLIPDSWFRKLECESLAFRTMQLRFILVFTGVRSWTFGNISYVFHFEGLFRFCPSACDIKGTEQLFAGPKMHFVSFRFSLPFETFYRITLTAYSSNELSATAEKII